MEREEFETTRRLLEAISNQTNKGLSRPVKAVEIVKSYNEKPRQYLANTATCSFDQIKGNEKAIQPIIPYHLPAPPEISEGDELVFW